MKSYTEDDIDGVMRYMKIFHPEKANRDYCEALLEYWDLTLKHMALNNPEDLEKIYEAFEASKNKS
jgi:hypothetical protein